MAGATGAHWLDLRELGSLIIPGQAYLKDLLDLPEGRKESTHCSANNFMSIMYLINLMHDVFQ